MKRRGREPPQGRRPVRPRCFRGTTEGGYWEGPGSGASSWVRFSLPTLGKAVCRDQMLAPRQLSHSPSLWRIYDNLLPPLSIFPALIDPLSHSRAERPPPTTHPPPLWRVSPRVCFWSSYPTKGQMTHVRRDWTGQLRSGCTEGFDWLWQLPTPALVFSRWACVCVCVHQE